MTAQEKARKMEEAIALQIGSLSLQIHRLSVDLMEAREKLKPEEKKEEEPAPVA